MMPYSNQRTAADLRIDSPSPVFPLPEVSATKPPRELVHLVGEGSQAHDLLTEALGPGVDVFFCESAQEFLGCQQAEESSCVILDFDLPDMPSLELQRRLVVGPNPPIVFVGNQTELAASVSAMKAGAIDFLTRPLRADDLIAAVQTALAQSIRQRPRKAEMANLKQRYGRLTPRESEVLPLVIGGLLNKQAAAILGISEVTLQIHRSQVMRKMGADSLADLVRMGLKLRIPYWRELPPTGGQRRDGQTGDKRRETTGANLSGSLKSR